VFNRLEGGGSFIGRQVHQKLRMAALITIAEV
jgi:hypothetical protein